MKSTIARCPDCGKVISLRFPIHDCTPKVMDDSPASDAKFLGISTRTLKRGGKPWKGTTKRGK